ncbi:thiamine pyrophosphate-binding protein [Acidianus brierleyi]|uniref:2-oxoacid oxidoreductase (ferredoxin) n=2 Tax=Acidianus brierleyi TaxID=41673 RepID=A0A2U9IJ22_9CREN|nr:thiamine pyrophosphate-binding protein [Acidianus brierleyi]
MNGANILLEMLERYNVKYVFGLPGETSLALYEEWEKYNEKIRHVLVRDERNSVYMADAYAKIAFQPGIVEGPSVGSTYMLPGIAEAYKSATPLIIITTDTPLGSEYKNVLTSIDQSGIFQKITKSTYTVYSISDLPLIIRKAFRISTSGRPGPVNIRIPSNVLEDNVKDPEIYSQNEFSKYPAIRIVDDEEKIKEISEMLMKAEKPVIICGQGVLYSQAWNEVTELAELLDIPVGSTITGKGCISELHPLSIGVVGGRGGSSFSNSVVNDADLIFLLGSNTDSANTNYWTIPSKNKVIVHIDISFEDLGNVYKSINVVGDIKAILRKIIANTKKIQRTAWRNEVNARREKFLNHIKELKEKDSNYINIPKLIDEMDKLIKDDILIADPGIGAISTAAFYKTKYSGRRIIFNYGMGGLGYSIPASVGAYLASRKHIIVLTGDGSFNFSVGELETIKRYNINVTIILFNNSSYGWIRAEMMLYHNSKYFDTDFSPIDYSKISEGFGLKSYIIEKNADIAPVLTESFKNTPSLVDIRSITEDRLLLPVEHWINKAKENKNNDFIY